MTIGFHCSHEQHPPSALLGLLREAERVGFRHAMCSDHFHPWSERQGHSGFSWSWLGAALAVTRAELGVVCAPGQRQHPALVAQAAATLTEMFPGRLWVAVGSGEALNESITGEPWPDKAIRQARLEESAAVIRSLWAGRTVTAAGAVRVTAARLFTRPPVPPRLLGAALTPETAARVGTWADGLITVPGPRDRMREVLAAFRATAGPDAPAFLQVALAFGPNDAESAAEAYEQWRHCTLPPHLLADLSSPDAFDRATSATAVDDVSTCVRVSADVSRQIAWLREDLDLGFDRVYLHNVVRDHRWFFDACEKRLLPELADAAGARR